MSQWISFKLASRLIELVKNLFELTFFKHKSLSIRIDYFPSERRWTESWLFHDEAFSRRFKFKLRKCEHLRKNFILDSVTSDYELQEFYLVDSWCHFIKVNCTERDEELRREERNRKSILLFYSTALRFVCDSAIFSIWCRGSEIDFDNEFLKSNPKRFHSILIH